MTEGADVCEGAARRRATSAKGVGTRRARRGGMDRITGLLIGTAVGDSLGLPREGLRPERARRMFGGTLRQGFVLGRGMISDDTEHACMTAQALLEAGEDEGRFARVLARKLRWWLAALPPGIGWGTLRALVRSWIGWSPARSGVRSAGNGAVMRAPIIGAWFEDRERMARFVEASTVITHRDPRANAGALAIAIAAHHAVRAPRIEAAEILEDVRARAADGELRRRVDGVEAALAKGWDVEQFAEAMGFEGGVSGYVHDTVAACLFAWLRQPEDARRVIEDVIGMGGDSDTTGAIAGALVGATVGVEGLPTEWMAVADWPRSITWIRTLGARVSARGKPLRLWWPAMPVRNGVMLAIALAHGLRRLGPPS